MKINAVTTHTLPVRTVTIKGTEEELQDLAAELRTWAPGGGWSEVADAFFDALTNDTEEDYDDND